MRVTLASRRSDLARIQAYQVGETLRVKHPQIEINYSFHESLGDKNLNDPLWQMPEKGVFTQDFRVGLLRGDYDLVVHSWKDLAIEDDPETEIIATLPRADARDLLLMRACRWPQIATSGSVTLLTSSPRRAYNLEQFLSVALPAKIKQLNFVNVRGNVPTRVRKLLQSDADGLIVAKAAIDRLLEAPQIADDDFSGVQNELRAALSQCLWMVMPLHENPSAPAQGALAVEISRRRPDMRELIGPINCAVTFASVIKEREILRSYGGGCHQKIGASVLRRPFGEVTFLRGLTDDGRVLNGSTLSAAKDRPSKVAREEMWPLDAADHDWFTREMIGMEAVTAPLWIAKADALPDDYQANFDQLVWASGVKTWRRLARRGVWVNGCAESLGEREDPRIDTLAGAKPRWVKLSHEDGYVEGDMPVVATYKLVAAAEPPAFRGKKYFFWKSGSSFEYALARHPSLKEMKHFCGPGNTARVLKRNGIEPHIFLDHQSWLREMGQNPDESG